MYEPGQSILDDSCRIERELGRGAFGLVYLARDQKLGVERAIRVLHADTPETSSVWLHVMTEKAHP